MFGLRRRIQELEKRTENMQNEIDRLRWGNTIFIDNGFGVVEQKMSGDVLKVLLRELDITLTLKPSRGSRIIAVYPETQKRETGT